MFSWFSKREELSDDEIKYLRQLKKNFIITVGTDKNSDLAEVTVENRGNVYLSPASSANVIFNFGDYEYIFPNNIPRKGQVLKVTRMSGRKIFLEFH